jgi:hypothetical protein
VAVEGVQERFGEHFVDFCGDDCPLELPSVLEGMGARGIRAVDFVDVHFGLPLVVFVGPGN